MNDLVQKQEAQMVDGEHRHGDASPLISMIERVALSPDADMDKMERLLDMQERVLNRDAMIAFNSDMAAMQADLPTVIEDGKGHNNAKYATLEQINKTIRPALQRHGFAVTFKTSQEANVVNVTAVLSHRQGHSQESTLSVPNDTSGNKNTVQAIGSSVSYGKRYALCALLNISTGDDDGQGSDVSELSELMEAIENLKSASDLNQLRATFEMSWSAFTSTDDRKRLNAAKEARKKELSA